MNKTANELCQPLMPFYPKHTVAVLFSIIFTSSINVLVMITAVCGNCLILYICWKFERLRTASNVFVGSLCLVGLLTGLIVVPISVARRLTEVYSHSSYKLLMAYRFLSSFLVGLSVLNIALISIDRCIAISSPFRYQKLASISRSSFIVLALWISLAAASLLLPLGIVTSRKFFVASLSAWAAGLFCVLVSYCFIVRIMRKHHRKVVAPLRKAIRPVVEVGKSTGTVSTRPSSRPQLMSSSVCFTVTAKRNNNRLYWENSLSSTSNPFLMNLANSAKENTPRGDKNFKASRVALQQKVSLAPRPLISDRFSLETSVSRASKLTLPSLRPSESTVSGLEVFTLPTVSPDVSPKPRRAHRPIRESSYQVPEELDEQSKNPPTESTNFIPDLADLRHPSTNTNQKPGTAQRPLHESGNHSCMSTNFNSDFANSVLDSTSSGVSSRKFNRPLRATVCNAAAKFIDRSVSMRSSRHNGISTVAVVILFLLVCNLPKAVVLLIRALHCDTRRFMYVIDLWCDMLLYLNATINPIIYGLRSSDIKECIHRILKIKQESWQIEIDSSSKQGRRARKLR